jgi:hypothetical protein
VYPHRRVAAGTALVITVLLSLAFVSQALAVTVTVNLAGEGEGSVVSSSPAGVDCSNVGGGAPGPTCSANLTDLGDFTAVLTGTAAADSVFAGWTVDGGFAVSGCTTPPGAPATCEAALVEPFEVTATFDPLPDPPVTATGESSAGAESYLRLLEGTVDPGGASVAECHFEYGPTAAYGARTPCVPAADELGSGMGPEPVSASTEPLEPGATYHYRLVASNVGGTGTGGDRVFVAPAASDDGCGNFARRLEQGIPALLLPGCMALEMVSPAQKGGQAARFPQVSASGERVRFRSLAALAGASSVLNPIVGSAYVATRATGGWQTAPTTPPAGLVSGWEGDALAHSYTPDFSSWFQVAATLSQLETGVARAFAGGLDGSFTSVSPLLTPQGGGGQATVSGGTSQGASADHSHLYLVPGPETGTSTAYLPGDPEPNGPDAEKNTYVAKLGPGGGPAPLELLARDEAHGTVWGGSCGARLGGADDRNQGAISADGGRTYVSARPGQAADASCDAMANRLRILRRLEGPEGIWIGELFASECDRTAPACVTADGDDLYQGASVDGSLVYFTTTRQLADSDIDPAEPFPFCDDPVGSLHATCDLYLFDATRPAGERLVQVSAGEDNPEHDAGREASVLDGTTAISGDGTRVYFVAEGVLTADSNPEGGLAVDGEPNLYAWERESESISFIGVLDPGDENGLWGGAGTFRTQAYPVPATGRDGTGNEVGGDGRFLVFQTTAPLTGDDGDGHHRDVFRYDAGGDQLELVSKATGVSGDEPFDVTARGGSIPSVRAAPGTDFAEQNRWASEDGGTIVFRTQEALLPGDVNGGTDFYLWRSGQLTRLPGKPYEQAALEDGPVLSHDGSTVAFQTYSRLLPEDGDTAPDVYVARVGGGFPFPPAAVSCAPDGAEACQGPPGAPPGAPPIANAPPGTRNLMPGRNCNRVNRRARRLAARAVRVRRRAARAGDRQAKRMRRRSVRLAKRARGLNRNAKRCRRAARREAR